MEARKSSGGPDERAVRGRYLGRTPGEEPLGVPATLDDLAADLPGDVLVQGAVV